MGTTGSGDAGELSLGSEWGSACMPWPCPPGGHGRELRKALRVFIGGSKRVEVAIDLVINSLLAYAA